MEIWANYGMLLNSNTIRITSTDPVTYSDKGYSYILNYTGNVTSGAHVGDYSSTEISAVAHPTKGSSACISTIAYQDYTDAASINMYVQREGLVASRIYVDYTGVDVDGDNFVVNSYSYFKYYADFVGGLCCWDSAEFEGGATVKGSLELRHATPHIDFHFGNSDADYTSRIIENSSGVLTVTGGLKVDGILDLQAAIKMRNGYQIKMAENTGTLRDVMYMGTSNNFVIGYGVSGNTNIFSGGGAVQLFTSADKVLLRNATDTAYTAHFIPGTNGKVTLGTVSNRWHSIYAASSTIGTSDVREKENIFALNDIHSKLFDKLQPVQFNFINTPSRICYGLIAQEVAEAMDELGIGENELDLVHHDYWVDEETNESKDSYGLAYNNLIAMLIHEVQKLKREVAALKSA